jgi:hypothetical protein
LFQTKDVTVSVVGTVFLVNAEEEGSQVAVIEGEVRVQHGAAERKLRPGEQVATGPSMEPQPVKEEISWSRNAEAHAVLLAQSSATLAAAKAGNVTGVVRTYRGSPASRVRVGAMRADAIDDALRAIAALSETDSMGRYRLENVPPGNYYITAGRANLPTYYPGTLAIAKGTVVSITSEVTISDIDFVLQDTSRPLPPRARSVRGHVVLDPDFSPVVASQQSPDRRRVRVLESEGQPARFVATAWTDDELERRLGLTEDQKKQIADIADQYLKVFLQNKSNFEREESILKRMTAPDSTESPKAISLQNDRVLAARKLWEAANETTVDQMLSILTEPQKQKLRAEVPAGGMRLGGLPIEEFLVLLQGSPGSPN